MYVINIIHYMVLPISHAADTALHVFRSILANFLSNPEERRTRKTLAAPIHLDAFRNCLQGQLEQLANETVTVVRSFRRKANRQVALKRGLVLQVSKLYMQLWQVGSECTVCFVLH